MKGDDIVIYIGASDEQVSWGSNDDPRELLEEGKEYNLVDEEVHTWHTKFYLEGFPGKAFNSVSFKRKSRLRVEKLFEIVSHALDNSIYWSPSMEDLEVIRELCEDKLHD